MNIRCLIIDDKPLAIDILVDYFSKVPFLELIATTTNPIEGLSIIRKQQIALVFLDIQMPQLTGLQFMRVLGKQCHVILTTAYSTYALEGFEHDVIDYLLKPISFERFCRATEKALQMIGEDRIQSSAGRVLNTINQSDELQKEYLFIKTEHRIRKLNLRDILFIEGLQNYISINCGIDKILSLQTLKKTEELLPKKEFVRVHKSYIVALRHITSIERSRIFIGDTIITVGDNYREGFYSKLDRN